MDLASLWGTFQQPTAHVDEASPEIPAEENIVTEEVAEPSRDEVTDASRGDQEGESRDEERNDNHHRSQAQCASDVSMFSTLTELLFNPFLDGYCKTPFCSDGDYVPPSCPSGGFYTTPERAHQYSEGRQHAIVPQPDYTCDHFGDICRSASAASSVHSSSQARRRRQRPLAFAVGHGDEWKDLEGRRVVITRSQHQTPTRLSPYRYRPPHHCTCSTIPESPNSNNSHDSSPHQTKAVVCKVCRLQDSLEVPASRSSGTISSYSNPITPPTPPMV